MRFTNKAQMFQAYSREIVFLNSKINICIPFLNSIYLSIHQDDNCSRNNLQIIHNNSLILFCDKYRITINLQNCQPRTLIYFKLYS